MGVDRDITRLLREWTRGDRSVEGELLRRIDKDLRKIIHRELSKPGARGITLQTTEMISELYLRIHSGMGGAELQNRTHFYRLCGRQMRQVLADMQREKMAEKRGGGIQRQDLDLELFISPELLGFNGRTLNFTQLDNALTDFEKVDPEKTRLVELRFYCGFTNEEVAGILEISTATAKRQWRMARAWLYDYLTRDPVDPSAE